METIETFANNLKADLSVLRNDAQRMITEIRKEEKQRKDSTKNTMMPVTNIYKGKESMESLKKDKNVDFIVNAVDHIFGKNT